MPTEIPVEVAARIGIAHDCRQVIVLAWDGETTYIVTWGKSLEDCDQAALGGNLLKQRWGWPECNDQPSRVRKLESRIAELEKQLTAAKAHAPGPAKTLDCVGSVGGKISF